MDAGVARQRGGIALGVAWRIIDTPARALVTGRCGPNLMGVLAVAGVPVFLAPEGNARGAIERYQRGELVASDLTGVPVLRLQQGRLQPDSERQRRSHGSGDQGRGPASPPSA